MVMSVGNIRFSPRKLVWILHFDLPDQVKRHLNGSKLPTIRHEHLYTSAQFALKFSESWRKVDGSETYPSQIQCIQMVRQRFTLYPGCTNVLERFGSAATFRK